MGKPGPPGGSNLKSEEGGPKTEDRRPKTEDERGPEELLLASLSSCHMLWYLHLCADAGIVVTAYVDAPEGTMVEEPGGAGHFTEVVLHPMVTLRADAHEGRPPRGGTPQMLHRAVGELPGPL